MTRKLLEQEQDSVISTLRGFHVEDGTRNDAMTALVVSLKTRGNSREPCIVLLRGTVRPSNKQTTVIRGKGSLDGLVISTIHLFSSSLRDWVMNSWEKHYRLHHGDPLSQNQHMAITHMDLKECLQGNFEFPTFGDGKTVLSPEICQELKFESPIKQDKGSYKYTMKLDMGYGDEALEFIRSTSLNDCVSIIIMYKTEGLS